MILTKIFKFGINKKYFCIKSLKDVSDNTCNCEELELIDFDETKSKIISEANQSPRSSCDGLYLKDSIDFIEFKSIQNFLNDEKKIIKEKLNDFDFEKKIRDSLWLFDFIIRHKDLKLNKTEINDIYKKINKNYFIVVDTEVLPLAQLTLHLNILSKNKSKLSNIKYMEVLIKEKIEEIRLEINKPKLLSCKQLEEYLK